MRPRPRRTKEMKKDRVSAHGLDAESADSGKIAARQTGALSRCSYPSRQTKWLGQRSGSSSCGMYNEGWMKTARSWSGRIGSRHPVSSRSSRQTPRRMVMMEHTASRSKLSRASRTTAAKARRANANANFYCAHSWGMGVSSVSCEVDDDRNRVGGDYVGFSCGQGKVIQTHDIDSSCLRCIYLYPEKYGKNAGKVREYVFKLYTLTTPHARERGELGPPIT